LIAYLCCAPAQWFFFHAGSPLLAIVAVVALRYHQEAASTTPF
jgi:hypothetical protein